MLLADLASTSATVASTSSRLAKVDAITACLRRAAPPEVVIVVCYLSGELRQRRPGVGWASLRELPAPAATPTLEVAEVDAAFGRAERAVGAGSQAARRAELTTLFGRATPEEQRFLSMLVGGELRISSYWSQPFYDSSEVQQQKLNPLYVSGNWTADSFEQGRFTARFLTNRAGSPCFTTFFIASSQRSK